MLIMFVRFVGDPFPKRVWTSRASDPFELTNFLEAQDLKLSDTTKDAADARPQAAAFIRWPQPNIDRYSGIFWEYE
jgi:hypothetical protein